jgi:signal transduction histidine kinase
VQWALLIDLVLGYPTGRPRIHAARVLVRVSYPIALIRPLVTLLGSSAAPCAGCASSVGLRLLSPGLTEQFTSLELGLWLVLLAIGLELFVYQFRLAVGRERRIMSYPVVAVAAVGLLLLAFMAQTVLARMFHLPIQAPLASAVELVGDTVMPVGFLLGLLRERLDRANVSDLVRVLVGTPTDALDPALSRALGDRDARLVFQAETGYIDLAGRPVSVDPRLAITPIGNLGAFLQHDRTLLTEQPLLDAVSNAAALALENARLHAEVLARLRDVTASRARLVEAGDHARRKLERDLHDGAQQSLLSLGLALRMLRGRLGQADAETVALLDETDRQARTAITELRQLAQGIHPAVLTEQGLVAAVEQLATRCPIPVDLDLAPVGQLSPGTEATAYFAISESLTNVVKHAHASSAAVCLRRTNDRLTVRITDDGTGGARPSAGSGLAGLADRIAAIAGALSIMDLPHGGTEIMADLPAIHESP